MSASNPLSSRCTAHAKTTGEQCRQWVPGGGVCGTHGGAAPQVRARREARVAALEAQQRGEPVEARDPAEALVAAAVAADVLVQQLQREFLDKPVSLQPAVLLALGEWLDRVGRLSKATIDARLDERHARLEEAGKRVGVLLGGTLRRILDQLELTADQEALVGVVVPRELRRLSAGELEVGVGRG